jgi:hypothetical protein
VKHRHMVQGANGVGSCRKSSSHDDRTQKYTMSAMLIVPIIATRLPPMCPDSR